MHIIFRLILLIASLSLFTGCDSTQSIRIGFLGGLTNINSDVGLSGLKGTQLAIEQFNRNGGINGRLIELVSLDDKMDKKLAQTSASSLVDSGVEAIVGPFMSTMVAAILPIVNEAKIVTISPTSSSLALYNKDDYLFRINRTTRDNARDYANELFRQGQHKIGVVLDTRNRVFTESWLNEFETVFTKIGGQVVKKVEYVSQKGVDYSMIIQEVLKEPSDGIFFISGALDVAHLAQLTRQQQPGMPISTAEWAGTEQLISLGGKVVEGLLVIQNFNREDKSKKYLAFKEAFFRRFNHDPGYSAVMSYDATMVLLESLAAKNAKQTLKQAILQHGPFQGLQQTIVFDKNGDTNRKVYFTQIEDGEFRLIN